MTNAGELCKTFQTPIIQKDKKGELAKLAGISGSSLAKLYRGENVNTEILVKMCNALRCDFSDIMEMEFDDRPDAKQ